MSEVTDSDSARENGTILIGDRPVGSDCATMVIAEIGVNHDGRLDRALELVKLAAESGADAIKLQVFSAEKLMNIVSQFAGYQKDRVQAGSPIEMLRQYELSDVAHGQVVQSARGLGLKVVATPFSLSDVPRIEKLRLDAVKIASPDLVNKPLLESASKLGLPMLISTGASTVDEIDHCAAWMDALDVPAVYFHCISSYPTGLAEAHLGWIRRLEQRLGRPVGYSDHTTDVISGALAVAAGACVIERHLTYDKQAAGPDHSASSDPAEMMRYIRLIRHAQMMLGRGERRVLPAEKDVRKVSRQSVVTTRAIAAGTKIGREDLTVQRPGTGIPAAQMMDVIGQVAARDIAPGEMFGADALQAE